MSAPMISGENARYAILPISSLLAMLEMIPVLKTPFKHGEPHGELSLTRRYLQKLAIFLIKESCQWGTRSFFTVIQYLKVVLQNRYHILSVAKSDEISKIPHLTFSREIMGADILKKLSLTTEKSLFAWGTAWGTLFNEQNVQLLGVLSEKESFLQGSRGWGSMTHVKMTFSL